MKVLVTGADGFVGSWVVPRLVEEGHSVIAAVRPGGLPEGDTRLRDCLRGAEELVELEVRDSTSVERAVSYAADAVIHLAAVSSGADAWNDPGLAWEVNAAGTARLCGYLGRRKTDGEDPLLLLVSSSEVYGIAQRAAAHRVELDPIAPVSPYASSKVGAEVAALEVHRRTGLRVVVARPFSHIGAGQDRRFVVPAFCHRILMAKKIGAPAVTVGNLEVVREFLHVSDVAAAYLLLLAHGRAGEVYNIASGQQIVLRELFTKIAEAVGHHVIAEMDAAHLRATDIPHLVGDGSKLRAETGWEPQVTLAEALAEVVNAETN
jgi:GDP-4-dehydro-6-deoxy-D-mannose reductase